jgi:hypothetical protein
VLADNSPMTRTLLLGLLVLSGCSASPNTAEQEQAIDIALEQWEMDFGFAPGCYVDRENVSFMVLADIDAVQERCNDYDADACHQRTHGGESVIVMHGERGTGYISDAYAHELAHWLQLCSGRGRDPEHLDRRVFEGFTDPLRARLIAEMGL